MSSRKNDQKDVHPGKVTKMLTYMIERYNLPKDEVVADMVHMFPELRNKEVCANCGASMMEYWYVMDSTNAMLLIRMGEIIAGKKQRGMAFEHANMVNLSREMGGNYSVVSRQTHCAKHGLIAKVLNEDGTHNREKGWLITRRGWAFLRNEPIPKRVKVWRNEIVERSDEETITISELLRGHYTYQPEVWMEYAGPHQGALL